MANKNKGVPVLYFRMYLSIWFIMVGIVALLVGQILPEKYYPIIAIWGVITAYLFFKEIHWTISKVMLWLLKLLKPRGV